MIRTMSRNVNSPRGLRRALVLYGVLFPAAVARYVPLPLRLIVGYGFAEHGFAKLLRGSDNFAGLLHAMGTPFPHFFAWITIVTEIAGGGCILLGAFVPLVSIPMAVVLLVAIFTVHLQYGFSSIKLQEITPTGAHFGQPGYETACFISPASRHWSWAAADRSPSTAGCPDTGVVSRIQRGGQPEGARSRRSRSSRFIGARAQKARHGEASTRMRVGDTMRWRGDARKGINPCHVTNWSSWPHSQFRRLQPMPTAFAIRARRNSESFISTPGRRRAKAIGRPRPARQGGERQLSMRRR